MNYAAVRLLHMSCAALSVSLFAARGALQLHGTDWRQWRWLRIAPHLNDTVLLGAALTLAVSSGQYPLAQGWLTAKVAGLVVYVVLGSRALRPTATRRQRALAFAGALASVAYIVAVAVTRSAALGLV
jgi:uncharacterized membrane protein SirB2